MLARARAAYNVCAVTYWFQVIWINTCMIPA
jgi:hypothetical protein